LKARGFGSHKFGHRNNLFERTNTRDCWVDPRRQNPYFNIPPGEALINGPDGPIGPQINPNAAIAYWGPRAGLINLCGFSSDIMFFHRDDDNGGRSHERESHHDH